MPGDNPYDKLAVPAFPPDNNQSTGGYDRFHPPPLSPETRILMQDDFHRQQRRRRQYRTGLLQVRVDGIERLHFDPRQGPCPALDVPLSASSVEVYGQDEAGELLLAVFPLAELLWAENDRVLRITYTGGQTLELVMAAEQGMPEDATGGLSCSSRIRKRPRHCWRVCGKLWPPGGTALRPGCNASSCAHGCRQWLPPSCACSSSVTSGWVSSRRLGHLQRGTRVARRAGCACRQSPGGLSQHQH